MSMIFIFTLLFLVFYCLSKKIAKTSNKSHVNASGCYRFAKRCKINGFSLVELSVVLAVIGTTLAGALTVATQKTESDKQDETETKLDQIETAIERFLLFYRRLPCPADGSLALSNANFGIAGTATTSGCTLANASSVNTYGGVVPTKTLGLSDDIMIDGWGRRIDYAVDLRFANSHSITGSTGTNTTCNGTTSTVCFKYTTAGGITVNDASGNARSSEAIYVLISHGPNGKGAYIRNGSATRLTDSSNADELNNLNSSAPVAYNSIFVQKADDGTFDDVVRYRPKWQMIEESDGITDSELCTSSKDVDNNPGANAVCGGATSVTICEALGVKIDSLCFDG